MNKQCTARELIAALQALQEDEKDLPLWFGSDAIGCFAVANETSKALTGYGKEVIVIAEAEETR